MEKAMNPELEDLSQGWYDDELLKKRDPEYFAFFKE
jgi:hypothetical protein